MSSERIIVGMSGGVDSAVAAMLLLQAGHDVVGVTLRLQDCQNPDGTRSSCCGTDSVGQARAVAGKLGIRHVVLEAQQEFAERVLRPCWQAYSDCRTPNPCVLCNEHIKFGRLLEFADSLGAAAVATGHYARLLPVDGRLRLWRGTDRQKDQSYFLFSLSPEQLARARFPLGELTKAEVRRLAYDAGLPNAAREESQDICFAVDEGGFAEYLMARFGGVPRAGYFVAADGRSLQPHKGAHRYTIGQRRGTGVAVGSRAWVKAIDAATGNVVLTTDENDLLAGGLEACDVVWHGGDWPGGVRSCWVQTRYRQVAVLAAVEAVGPQRFRVRFLNPVKAVCPGQAAVFYDGELVLGGGWIQRSLPVAAAGDQ